MKQTSLFKQFFLLVLLLVGSATGAWAATITEGFETKAAESTYNSTKTISTSESDCGIAWNIYYGCVSTNDKISGARSAQMRLYNNQPSTYPHMETTTAIEGLTNVSFKARVSNTSMKLDVSTSTDGKNWVVQEAAHTFTGTTAAEGPISVDVPSGHKYVKFSVNSNVSKPSSGNIKLIIDDVVFTFSGSIAPSISVNDVEIEYNVKAGTIESTINNPVDGGVLSAAKKTTADWLTLGTVSGTSVSFTATANDTNEDREATVTLTYTYNTSETVTEDVTITQKHFVVDYATLPFNWDGGSSAGLLALDGVTASGLGEDYGSNHTPYNVRFDTTNDYIQIKTDSKPGIVTIGVKMVGGPNDSYISVQGSADGETFTEVEKLEISGAQHDIVNLTTSNDFANTDRYVRLVFTKGSNVGVGPITISKGNIKTTTTTTIDASGINTNLDEGTAAGQLTASVKAGETPVDGATITWTSSDESVAIVDTEGNVTLKKKGTTTITATYAGDETYASSSGTYVLKVTSSAQVMNVSIDLTNTFWGQDVHTSGDATEDLVFTGSKENIIVTYYVPKGSHYYVNTSNTRVYDTDDIQVDAPAGYVLETITFTPDGSNWNDATPTTGAMSTSNSKLWEGPANTVRFHWNVTGTRIKTIIVTLKEGATVSDAKWATYVTPKDIDFTASTGVTAYKVTGANGKIELEEVDAAPKGTPLVIAAEENTYVLNVAASAPTEVTGNLLKAADGTQTGDGTGNFYVLGKDNQGKVGFGPLANDVTLAVGKAYIDGTEVTAKGFLPFVIDEENETTSINSIENSELRIENYDYIYNLAGQKVSKDYKGIVVVNGKKVIRK